MKVQQLISQLQGLDPNLDVVIENATEILTIVNISVSVNSTVTFHPNNGNAYLKVSVSSFRGPKLSVAVLTFS